MTTIVTNKGEISLKMGYTDYPRSMWSFLQLRLPETAVSKIRTLIENGLVPLVHDTLHVTLVGKAPFGLLLPGVNIDEMGPVLKEVRSILGLKGPAVGLDPDRSVRDDRFFIPRWNMSESMGGREGLGARMDDEMFNLIMKGTLDGMNSIPGFEMPRRSRAQEEAGRPFPSFSSAFSKTGRGNSDRPFKDLFEFLHKLDGFEDPIEGMEFLTKADLKNLRNMLMPMLHEESNAVMLRVSSLLSSISLDNEIALDRRVLQLRQAMMGETERLIRAQTDLQAKHLAEIKHLVDEGEANKLARALVNVFKCTPVWWIIWFLAQSVEGLVDGAKLLYKHVLTPIGHLFQLLGVIIEYGFLYSQYYLGGFFHPDSACTNCKLVEVSCPKGQGAVHRLTVNRFFSTRKEWLVAFTTVTLPGWVKGWNFDWVKKIKLPGRNDQPK